MRVIKKILLITLICGILFYLFLRDNEIYIENEKVYETYENLPQAVKAKLTEVLETKDTTQIFSLDKNYNAVHYWTGMNKQIMTKGFREHFIINGKYKFKMNANKGDPFILHNKILYFPIDLNYSSLKKPNETNYYKIDLNKYIK